MLGIHSQMMGTEVHGRAAIEAAFERELYAVYGVASFEQLNKVPFERLNSGASNMLENMSGFMNYVMNIERVALGCLMNADLIDFEFRNLDLIKKQKKDMVDNVTMQFEKARNLLCLFGMPDTTVLLEIERSVLAPAPAPAPPDNLRVLSSN